MSNCDRIRDDVKAWVDGELKWPERARVRKHLAACEACRQEVRDMEQVGAHIRSADARAGEAMPAALRERILTAVEQDSDEAPAPAARERPFWRRPLTAWGATAAAALVLVGWSAYNEMAPRGAVSSMASQDSLKAMTKPEAGGDTWAHSARAAANAPEAAKRSGTAPGVVSAGGPPRVQGALEASEGRTVQREARLSVAVPDIDAGVEAMERKVEEAGGWVQRSAITTSVEGVCTAVLELRLPVGKFEGALKVAAALGRVTERYVVGQDITAAIAEAEETARLLEAQAARYERAASPESGMRAEAARSRARARALRATAATAAIDITLIEAPRERVNGGGFVDEMQNTGRSAANAFLAAARVPLTAAVWLLAYAPIWLPLALAYRWAARAQRRRVDDRAAREWQARRASGEPTA